MPFAESLKADLRRRADMRCCVCHAIGVEIHHIIPRSEGGSDSEDNAAPLCPTCHETYGANPTKRKLIREARDNWFEACNRQAASRGELDRVIELARQGIKPADLTSFRAELVSELQAMFLKASTQRSTKGQPIAEILFEIYNCKAKMAGNEQSDQEFLYFFVWDGSISEEYDDLKNEFVGKFGTETALCLCAFLLKGHKYSLTVDGFTEPEMSELINHLFCAMVFLLHHQEVSSTQQLEVALTDNKGELRAWALPQAPIDEMNSA